MLEVFLLCWIEEVDDVDWDFVGKLLRVRPGMQNPKATGDSETTRSLWRSCLESHCYTDGQGREDHDPGLIGTDKVDIVSRSTV